MVRELEREDDKRPGLQRSKTTINVPSNARELSSEQRVSPKGQALFRNNTTITLGVPSPPVRGLARQPSTKQGQAGNDPSATTAAPTALPAKGLSALR